MSPAPAPRAVVVGAASRDVAPSDPRGWRLGGGVSYGALTMARLGLPTGALVGADPGAAAAWELDLLRSAGVDVRIVPLDRGPVFENIERPEGRVQVARSPADPIPATAVPDAWRSVAGWLLAPVAAELPDGWAGVAPAGALVALGWQGLLRRIESDRRVVRVPPVPSRILARADLVGLSRDDVEHGTALAALTALLGPRAMLLLTHGAGGGLIVDRTAGRARILSYPAVAAARTVDPTGAGDVMLAALTALRLDPSLLGAGGATVGRSDLLAAAAAASLVVEDEGLLGVPDRGRLRDRIASARATRLGPPPDDRA